MLCLFKPASALVKLGENRSTGRFDTTHAWLQLGGSHDCRLGPVLGAFRSACLLPQWPQCLSQDFRGLDRGERDFFKTKSYEFTLLPLTVKTVTVL